MQCNQLPCPFKGNRTLRSDANININRVHHLWIFYYRLDAQLSTCMVNKLSQRGPLASPIDRPVDRYPLTKSHYITQSPDNMKVSPVLLIVLLSCVCVSYCKDLIVGTSFNNRLAWQEKAEYNSIPFKKRVKEIFYSDPGQQIIKVILFVSHSHLSSRCDESSNQ